jgi:hypothetical protein
MAGVAIRARNAFQLARALDARRRLLGMTMVECDNKSGLQEGYSAKVFAGIRGFGHLSLPTLLDTLGVDMLIVPRDLADEPIERRRTHVDPSLGRVLALPKPDAPVGTCGQAQRRLALPKPEGT